MFQILAVAGVALGLWFSSQGRPPQPPIENPGRHTPFTLGDH